MARKHESWEAYTATQHPLQPMGDEVVKAAAQLVGRVQDRSNITWDELGGHGGFSGLSQAVERTITPRMARCALGKQCRLVVGISDVEAERVMEGSDLDLYCPSQMYDTEEQAEADERHCQSHHQAVAGKFGDWVVNTMATVERAEADILEAQQRIADAF